MFKVKITGRRQDSNNQAVLSLKVKDPNDLAPIIWKGDNSYQSAIYSAFGFRHSLSKDACNVFDLNAALISLKIDHEVIEGAELLDMPEAEIPEGAID